MRNRSKTETNLLLIATRDIPYGIALERFLQGSGYSVERCHDAQGVLRLAGRYAFQVAVLDLALQDESSGGVDLVSFIRRQTPSTRVLLLFDVAKIDRAIEGIRRGAFFYLPNTSELADIALVVEKAVYAKRTQETADQYEQDLFEGMAGASPAMKRVAETIAKVAPTDSTVLLIGESGTGKEILANTIHRLSRRNEMPFIAVNCAALPEGLLESELYGHMKGAFTGAETDKRGLFEEADGGTLFLDEIGDMALSAQAKLLRVLQNGEIRRVGSGTVQRVDVRVIAATNRDLVEAVTARQFREDLYFRLNVIQIRIPPLRERMDALPALVNHFVMRFNVRFGKGVSEVDDHAWALLRGYSFPGNVRELESVMAHAVIMSDGVRIRATDLPEQVQRGGPSRLALPNFAAENMATLEEMEADMIRHALEQLEGNQTEAAKRLGISRSTLWRKMKAYGIGGAE